MIQPNYNGVIEKSTGDLLRYGDNIDFENDGNFDSVNEEIKTSLPASPKRRGQPGEIKFHRWNGSAWVEVDYEDIKHSYEGNGGTVIIDIKKDRNYFVHILLKSTTTFDFANPVDNGFVTVLVEQDSTGLHHILFDVTKIKVDYSLAQLDLRPGGKTTFSFTTKDGVLHMNSAVHAVK